MRLVLVAAVLLSACSATPTLPPAEQPLTPLEQLAGYRLTDAVTEAPGGLAVGGVSPAVSGSDGTYRFMVRPATHEVVRVDATGNLAAWGKLGGEAGRFNHPESLFVAKGQVFVADTGNHRVQVFDLNGKPLGAWGSFGQRAGQFMHPRSVEVTAGGLVMVVDDYSLQYFAADGTSLGRVPMLVAPPPADRSLAQVKTVSPAKDLPTFLATHPGAAGLAQTLKAKGMTDAEILALLNKSEDQWLGALGAPPAPGAAPAKVGSASLVTASTQNVQTDIYAFMALFQKLAQEMRDNARGNREAALQAQVSQLQAEADKIKQAADARFQAAIVQGAMQIGAGAVQIGAGIKAGAPLTGKGTEINLGSAIGKMATGIGGEREIGSLAASAQAKAASESAIKHMDAATAKADDMMQQMQGIISDIRAKLTAIEQANVETNRGIARNI